MQKKKIKIGIIGCGAIGREIAKAIDAGFKDSAALVAVSDADREKAGSLRKDLKNKPKVLPIDALIKKSDLVIEAASAEISGLVAQKAIRAKKDVMIMSTGGIAKDHMSISRLARKAGVKVYLPSGAICGIDGVKAALLGKIRTAELITRKPPAALRGAPFIVRHRIDLDSISSETMIFDGSARDAIKGFPANINVSCTLSMAGIGLEKTRVKIVTSPEYKTNSHELVVEGSFGRLSSRTENVPSPSNPKTSYLAVLSAIATLKQILGPFKIGT